MLQQLIFSPCHLGIPVHRTRSYCLLTLKSKIVIDIPWELKCAQELLFQELRTTDKVYFRAPNTYVSRYLAQHEREDPSAEGESPARRCLTLPQLSRLDEHLFAGLSEDKDFLCVAYSQNRSFVSFDEYVPALTTSAAIWGKNLRDAGGVDRMLLPIEMLATQGWAVLLDEG